MWSVPWFEPDLCNSMSQIQHDPSLRFSLKARWTFKDTSPGRRTRGIWLVIFHIKREQWFNTKPLPSFEDKVRMRSRLVSMEFGRKVEMSLVPNRRNAFKNSTQKSGLYFIPPMKKPARVDSMSSTQQYPTNQQLGQKSCNRQSPQDCASLLAFIDKYGIPTNQWTWFYEALLEVSMTKIALWICFCADDWAVESALKLIMLFLADTAI